MRQENKPQFRKRVSSPAIMYALKPIPENRKLVSVSEWGGGGARCKAGCIQSNEGAHFITSSTLTGSVFLVSI